MLQVFEFRKVLISYYVKVSRFFAAPDSASSFPFLPEHNLLHCPFAEAGGMAVVADNPEGAATHG
jgi:hypothetical protein